MLVEILRRARTIAIVGLSRDPGKDSRVVARYLISRGYRVIPINPMSREIMGLRSYPSLLAMPPELARSVDVVDVFVPPRLIRRVVEDCIEMRRRYGKPDLVWLQRGLADEEAAEAARAAGMEVAMDMCIMEFHRRHLGRGG